jgi:hypothetical protein
MLGTLTAALDLIHEGPPPERIMEHASYCPRERRRVERWRHHLDHTERVILARTLYLMLYGETRPGIWGVFPPRWTPGAGLRTVCP